MLEVFTGSSALADAAAQATIAGLAAGLADRGRGVLVATGGRSPGPVYDRLSQAPLDWGRIAVTLCDERQVDVDSPNSNSRLLRERLFVGLAAQARFLPLTDYAEPALKALLPADVTLLGMGEDGHVASLIPGSPGLAEAMDPGGERLLAESPAGFGAPPVARITLTLPALLQTRLILLLISGGVKRQVVDQALAGADLPVRAILTQAAAPVRVLWAEAEPR